MKLWHDDVRPAPEGWTWAKTNIEAMELLLHNEVEEISLDHDLGAILTGRADDLLLCGNSPDGTGLDLVKWMCANGKIPAKVAIHSWNPVGASRMSALLAEQGCIAVVEPFQIERP